MKKPIVSVGAEHALRIEVRAKNNVLWHAIYDRFKTIAAFCRRYRLDKTRVGELVSLKRSPLGRDGKWSPICQRLARYFGMLEEDLFPLELYKLKTTRAVIEVPIAALTAAETRRVMALPAEETPYDSAEKKSLTKQVTKVLATLTQREERVLNMLYGLNGEDACSVEAVAEDFELTPERIEQVKNKAIRKLRHPSRSKRLRAFTSRDI